MSMHVEIGTRSGKVTMSNPYKSVPQEEQQVKTELVAQKNSPSFFSKLTTRISRAFGLSQNNASTKKIKEVVVKTMSTSEGSPVSERNAPNPFTPDHVRNMKPLSSAAPIIMGIDPKGNPIYKQLHNRDNDNITQRRLYAKLGKK